MSAQRAAAFVIPQGVEQVLDDRVKGEQSAGGPEVVHALDDELPEAGAVEALREADAFSCCGRIIAFGEEQFGRLDYLRWLDLGRGAFAGLLTPEIEADLLGQSLAVFGRTFDRWEAGGGTVFGVGPVAEGVDGGDLHRREFLEGLGRTFFLEQIAHALAHLEGGRVGERHEEDFRDIRTFGGHLFDDADEVIGLAGAGAGFDDDEARGEAEAADGERSGGHGRVYLVFFVFTGCSSLNSFLKPLSLSRVLPARAFFIASTSFSGLKRAGASRRPKRSWISPSV